MNNIGGMANSKIKTFRTPSGEYQANTDVDTLGSGTYGTVFRVRHVNNDKCVKALKTFSANGICEDEGIPATTIRELNAMKLMDFPNVIRLHEVVYPTDGDISKMFYTMELCKGSLSDKMKNMVQTHLGQAEFSNVDWSSRKAKRYLPTEYVKQSKIAIWQLLNGVAYMHSWGITHRDLKPANIMWDFNDYVKIGDFGLARFVRGKSNNNHSDSAATHTGEVQTLWYRAPEVLLGDEQYGAIVDDWSVGCILAEMFCLRYFPERGWRCIPLFPGDGEIQTLMLILQTSGTPKKGTVDYQGVCKFAYWSDSLPTFRLPSDIKAGLAEQVPLLDETGLDLLSKLLCLNPGSRMASRFLIDHEWFSDIQATVIDDMGLRRWNQDLFSAGLYDCLKVCENVAIALPVKPHFHTGPAEKDTDRRATRHKVKGERAGNNQTDKKMESKQPDKSEIIVQKKTATEKGRTARATKSQLSSRHANAARSKNDPAPKKESSSVSTENEVKGEDINSNGKRPEPHIEQPKHTSRNKKASRTLTATGPSQPRPVSKASSSLLLH